MTVLAEEADVRVEQLRAWRYHASATVRCEHLESCEKSAWFSEQTRRESGHRNSRQTSGRELSAPGFISDHVYSISTVRHANDVLRGHTVLLCDSRRAYHCKE
jgi:hypothetical protein